MTGHHVTKNVGANVGNRRLRSLWSRPRRRRRPWRRSNRRRRRSSSRSWRRNGIQGCCFFDPRGLAGCKSFVRFVLCCIKAEFCNKRLILQHYHIIFQYLQDWHAFAPLHAHNLQFFVEFAGWKLLAKLLWIFLFLEKLSLKADQNRQFSLKISPNFHVFWTFLLLCV